jgi:hypothetical protein
VVVIATDLLKILFYSGVLWPTGSNEEKVKILYTDGVAYMLKAGKNLKVFYPAMLHVTCLAHGLNLVAELVRNEYPMVNKLISNTKKVFLKAPLRREVYTEKCPNLKLPPEPVLTRWGTWLEAAVFYQENFTTIKDVSTYVIPYIKIKKNVHFRLC